MAGKPVRARNNRISTPYIAGNVAYKQAAKPAAPVRAKRPASAKKAMPLQQAYVMLFAVCAVIAVAVCTLYIKEQARMIASSEKVAAMQMELAALTEKNDSAYNAIDATVNLDTIRDRAVNELGMVPVSEGSVVTYRLPKNEAIRQYSSIPRAGVLSGAVYRQGR